MKTRNTLRGLALAAVLRLGMLAGSAQTNKYLYTGTETNITLPPGTYIITAYGAPGGGYENAGGGHGAEMSSKFNFSASTKLTLLVGGGGGGSFAVESNTPLVFAGGGGATGGLGPVGGAGDNGSVSTNGGNVNTNGGTGGGGGGGGNGGGGYLANGGGGGAAAQSLTHLP